MKNAWLFCGIAMLAGCMGWIPGRQTYWDVKVKELCEKDGGVTVYERVRITQSEYERLGGSHGVVPVPSRAVARPGSLYVADRKVTKINEWDPEVWRTETEVVRVADSKVLARAISYTRRGGDAPIFVISHPSSYSCIDAGVRFDIEKQTFEVAKDNP